MKKTLTKQRGISTIIIVILIAFIFVFLITDIILFTTIKKRKATTNDKAASQTNTSITPDSSEDTTDDSSSLPDYKSAYYSVLKEKQEYIENYDWQYGFEYDEFENNCSRENTPIALADINGDDIPELLVAYCTDEYDSKTSAQLDIYSVDSNGSAKLLYNNSTLDVLAGGGTGYYLFTTADNPHLFAYYLTGEEAPVSYIWEFIPQEDGTLETSEVLSYEEELSDDFEYSTPIYYKNGQSCSKDEYNSNLNNLLNNMTHFLMYNANDHIDDTVSSILAHTTLDAMTYGQAYRQLGLTDSDENSLPLARDVNMTFSSGAGGWKTVITLHPDGTFTGKYTDVDMGDSGDDYDSTMRICEFDGKFIDIKKVDDDSYSMTLEYCNSKDKSGATWIEDRIQYTASDPYGIDGGKNFTLYLPGTLVNSLPENYVLWVYDLDKNTTTSGFGLYNTEGQEGFYESIWSY